MPMRSTSQVTCQGTSDNVHVPVDEFRATMDGAVRVARNFDDGVSECGLHCDPSILAIDTRLNPYYKSGERVAPLKTRFPC